MVSRFPKFLMISLAVADLVIFGLSNSHQAATPVLFAGFLLLIANFYFFLLAALRLAAWYGLSLGVRRKGFIKLATGLFAGLVALQSVGQLSLLDVLVALPLLALAYLYVSYGAVRV